MEATPPQEPTTNVIVVTEINSRRIVGVYTNQEDADRKCGESRAYTTDEYPLMGDTPPSEMYLSDHLVEGLRSFGPAKVAELLGRATELWLAADHQVGGSEPRQPSYPYSEGDVLVIGPQAFITYPGGDDMVVINYQGENFVPQPEPDAPTDEPESGAKA